MPDLPGDASAAYVFRVEFRVSPRTADTSVDPDTFETTLYRTADPPGEDGWLFFRDTLWRGAANDERHLRELATDALGVEVTGVRFSELRTTAGYLDALTDAIDDELGAAGADSDGAAVRTFGNADSVQAVLKHYLGSSIHVVD